MMTRNSITIMLLRFDPVYIPAQVGMVKLFLDRGDTVKAQHYFENYLNLVGDNPSNIVKLAREFQDQRVDNYAMACFNKALEIAPKSAEVQKALGFSTLAGMIKTKQESISKKVLILIALRMMFLVNWEHLVSRLYMMASRQLQRRVNKLIK